MILFRSPRRHGRVRVHVRKPGLTDREVADMLAPRRSGDVEFAPVDPPLGEPKTHPDGSIDPDERSQWAHNLP